MGYSRDRWANPLKHISAKIEASQRAELDPITGKPTWEGRDIRHLRCLIIDLKKMDLDWTQQIVAANAVFAYAQMLPLMNVLNTLDRTSREFRGTSAIYMKYTRLFKEITGVSLKAPATRDGQGKGRRRPPARPLEVTPVREPDILADDDDEG